MPDPRTLTLIDPDGRPHEMSAEDAAAVLGSGSGWRVQQTDDVDTRLAEQGDEEDYGGVGGTIAATAAGAARTVTLGASDAIIDAAGGGEELNKLREVNPTASTVGEVAGAFVPVGAAAAASRLGTRIARGAGEGASLATQVGRAAAGYGTEGAIIGAGQGVSELALSDDPLTVENIASTLSSNILYGGVIGAGTGTAAKLAEKGMLRAKAALTEGTQTAEAQLKVAEDLAGLDAKGLRTAREIEMASLEAARVPQRAELASELAAFRKELKDQKLWLATKGAEERELREVGKIALKADRQLDTVLNNPKALAENPKRALAALQQQEHALEQLAKNSDTLRARITAEQDARAMFQRQRDTGMMGADIEAREWVGRLRRGEGTDAELGLFKKLEAESADGTFKVDAGATRLAALDGSAVALERNRALQARIGELTGTAASPRLTAIDDAKDALVTGATSKGMPEQLLQGSVFSGVTALASPLGPLAPIIGARAASAVTGRLFGRLGDAASGAAKRSKEAVAKFLDVGAKGARSAPVLATKVLTRVRYAADAPAQDDTKPAKLADSYRARTAEVRSQTAYGPDGRAVLRPEARAKMADGLSAIRAVNPLLADRIETIAARRLEFLANKLPRRPDLVSLRTGPDRWQPSELEMRTWARFAAAIEDPGGIEERLTDGTITPEDAEVMRQVYPERFAAIQAAILEQLPTLQKQLPYARRLALSIFSGVPVDPAMNPRILRVLQAQFAQEQGGGTQAPLAQPQFGSVKAAPLTPAQERATGGVS